jgi:cytochrome c oxidase subunit 4
MEMSTPAVQPPAVHSEEHHPGPRVYVRVAFVLAVITAMEVTIYYIKSARGILVPALIFFSTIKFALVVLNFMHLRFDSRIFRRLFAAGLALAFGVFTIVLVTLGPFVR